MRLKIASYNLFEGAKDSYFRLVDFAKEQQFDVLCLQEINGWQDDDFARLKDFADRAGFIDWEFGNSNSDFKLATLSTQRFSGRTNHQEGFWHCVIETHLNVDGQELCIINLDLDPFGEEPRLREINKLLNKLNPSLPTLITGNCNSLSRADKYGESFLAELTRRDISKYGRANLDYAVTDYLAEQGFSDIAVSLGRLEPTVPSAYPIEQAENIQARIDYVFANAPLAPLITNFEVIKDRFTDKISDHYPIVVTLGEEAPAPQAKESEATAQPVAPASEGEILLR